MDLNEQLDQNAADFSQAPPVPVPTPGMDGGAQPPSLVTAEPDSGTQSYAVDRAPRKSVTKFQIALVLVVTAAALGIFYYYLSRPAKLQGPVPKLSPPTKLPN